MTNKGEVKFYTVLNAGDGQWSLPLKELDGSWTPGEWMKGYQVSTGEDLLDCLGPQIYEVEVRGELLYAHAKGAARSARLLRRIETWDEQTARSLACDFADRVLPIFEETNPGNPIIRNVIALARRFADDQATAEAPGWPTDWTPGWAAAGAAAWAAAWAAAGAAADAAGAAADAAEAAAWAAAWAAERQWQTHRLLTVLGEETGHKKER